jgi:hypothetical protein
MASGIPSPVERLPSVVFRSTSEEKKTLSLEQWSPPADGILGTALAQGLELICDLLAGR